MSMRDLIPWNRGRGVTVRRSEDANPFLTLHREMNRVFDDVFRGFDLAPFGFDHTFAWPNVEVSETDKELKVTADLPGLEEKDVEVELANGILTIKGEKKTEMEDKERKFDRSFHRVHLSRDFLPRDQGGCCVRSLRCHHHPTTSDYHPRQPYRTCCGESL